MKKAVAVAVLVVFSFPGIVWSTNQYGDFLMLEGNRHWFSATPLEPYFEKNPKKRPGTEIKSTALRRQYIATWEIIEGRLMLMDVGVPSVFPIVPEVDAGLNSVFLEIFPKKKPVWAEWYTGNVFISYGEPVEYFKEENSAIFGKYSMWKVVKGNVVGEHEMDVEKFIKFRKNQFLEYKKTEDFRSSYESLIESGKSQGEAEKWLHYAAKDHYLEWVFDLCERGHGQEVME